ncbi:OmpH family outer membrane protein [Chondromyces crocatus]|uniref:OmpH family outer membrane protein n=1 Tax=Chondromyces crocatus TaxID=52 RepID=UPI001FDECEBA|nr:OmpH family outer membrane protein [Chondromyces crocatus]
MTRRVGLPARFLVALLPALLAFAPARDAAAQTRIGVVDLQHAVMQTEDGIRAQATLKKVFDKKQHDLDAKQTELQRAREDIERQSRVLSREALQKRMEDWQRQMVELQTVFVDYNKELQKRQGELTNPIIKKMMMVINRVAKKQGFELIIDKQAAPYARPDLDLTEQIIQLYNSGGGGDGGGEEGGEPKGDKQPAASPSGAPR